MGDHRVPGGATGVPPDLREAARVDGASPLREFRHIVIPSMRFVIADRGRPLFIWNFNWFDMMWLLTQGGPGNATEVLPIDIYRRRSRRSTSARRPRWVW